MGYGSRSVFQKILIDFGGLKITYAGHPETKIN